MRTDQPWYLEDILSGECGGGSPVQDIGHREMFAVLPSGRRLDPTP